MVKSASRSMGIGLVWFFILGKYLWGDIMYVFDANLVMSLVGYLLGLGFGVTAKNKGWSWIS